MPKLKKYYRPRSRRGESSDGVACEADRLVPLLDRLEPQIEPLREVKATGGSE